VAVSPVRSGQRVADGGVEVLPGFDPDATAADYLAALGKRHGKIVVAPRRGLSRSERPGDERAGLVLGVGPPVHVADDLGAGRVGVGRGPVVLAPLAQAQPLEAQFGDRPHRSLSAPPSSMVASPSTWSSSRTTRTAVAASKPRRSR